MTLRTYKDYIKDILTSVEEIEEFTRTVSDEKFFNDKKTINAVIRSLEVMGEAAKKIPVEICRKYPKIPWSKIVGMRNILIHEYFGVDIDLVWQTAKDELPELKPSLEELKQSKI